MSEKSRVFVVQRPAYFNRARRGWVNKYDITAAEDFGELKFLLNPGNIYKDKLETAIEHLQEDLSDYTSNDYILAIGDPVAIAATVTIAAFNNAGVINLLKFDRISQKYDAYQIVINNYKSK